ncbi:MAG: hypothetical protein HKP60_12480 [Eudoraea sp.]|nr:PD40 domain-containing protein [Eudoraea sp.]NNJ41678.1 hypothetical protein [Eudoraea sp.]
MNIVYNVLVDAEGDNYEVFVMDMDGKNPKNITNLKGVEWTYYADGDKVYYISDKDTLHRYYFLYRMQPDGSEKIKVSNIRLADSWHSSRFKGKELIVRPHSSVDTAFYIIDTSGKVIKKLRPPFPYFSDPLFSPDGSQIVFRAAKAPFKRNEMFRDELYMMNDEGDSLRQLTFYPEGDTTAIWHNYKAGPPRWNTRENFISYHSFQEGKYSLFAVSPDGKRHWKLTDLKYSEGWHDWSPDGKYLAVEVFDKGQTQFHIGFMNWDTRDFSILTDTLYRYQQAPVFVKVPGS